MPTGIFIGRLVTDGNGNLLADEGDWAGWAVAFDEAAGGYIFVQPGEPSHNERHELQKLGMDGTQAEDPDLPGYAGTEDNPTPGMEHHFAPLPDDPNAAGLRQLPDRESKTISGHTEAYRG